MFNGGVELEPEPKTESEPELPGATWSHTFFSAGFLKGFNQFIYVHSRTDGARSEEPVSVLCDVS